MKEYLVTLRLTITEPLVPPDRWCWGILLDLGPEEAVEVIDVLDVVQTDAEEDAS